MPFVVDDEIFILPTFATFAKEQTTFATFALCRQILISLQSLQFAELLADRSIAWGWRKLQVHIGQAQGIRRKDQRSGMPKDPALS